MLNPLLNLSSYQFIPFENIRAEHIQPAIDTIIAENQNALNEILSTTNYPTFENLIWPLEVMDSKLNEVWATVSHLDSVMNSTDFHAAYQGALSTITLYQTERGQHEKLYQAVLTISKNPEFVQLNAAQQKIVDNTLRDFKLSGIALSPDAQNHFKQLSVELSELESQFEQNILEATQAWSLLIVDKTQLIGLPDSALEFAREQAKERQEEGWLLTLDYPSYHAVMTYLENRTIRETVYQAYVTRASAEFPAGASWDNSEVMVRILQIREELSHMLGFDHYVDYALSVRMLKKATDVNAFLENVRNQAKKMADQEMIELKNFAAEDCGIAALAVWDIAYVSEKMRQTQLGVCETTLRQYFSVENVLAGLFAIVYRLYGIVVKEIAEFDQWHGSIRLFEAYDANNQLRGIFYIDLYVRPNKRGGAWVNAARDRLKQLDGKIQIPMIYIVTNFSKATEEMPALLTHDEVVTLFHEFGHCLHGIFSLVDYPSISGLQGVPWDAVELPSQLMENWCWEEEALNLITKHYQTGQILPEAYVKKLKASKVFQVGLYLARQLEFALFDMEIHMKTAEEHAVYIQETVEHVRRKTAAIDVPAFNRFQNSFSHIFAGGYAAGYYSYLWSEVLSADSFDLFKEKGLIFDKEVAQRFLAIILEQGGSKDFMDMFMEFRGQAPNVEALLRQYHFCKNPVKTGVDFIAQV